MRRARAVLILAMAKTNMATGRKKYGNIAVEKVFGELAFGDQEMVIYARTRYLFSLSFFFFSLFLEHCKQWTETKCGKGGWRVERSSLENVQRRGKLNLFGRLSGMDSSKSSRSRLMRFSAITPAKSNEFFFLSFFWLESPGGKFFCPI